jgi:hypothetical protein
MVHPSPHPPPFSNEPEAVLGLNCQPWTETKPLELAIGVLQYADFQEAQRAQATVCDCGLNL